MAGQLLLTGARAQSMEGSDQKRNLSQNTLNLSQYSLPTFLNPYTPNTQVNLYTPVTDLKGVGHLLVQA